MKPLLLRIVVALTVLGLAINACAFASPRETPTPAPTQVSGGNQQQAGPRSSPAVSLIQMLSSPWALPSR